MWVDFEYSNIKINDIRDEGMHGECELCGAYRGARTNISFKNVISTENLDIIKEKTVLGISNRQVGKQTEYTIYLKETFDKPKIVADSVAKVI